jgi:hypothetical protein
MTRICNLPINLPSNSARDIVTNVDGQAEGRMMENGRGMMWIMRVAILIEKLLSGAYPTGARIGSKLHHAFVAYIVTNVAMRRTRAHWKVRAPSLPDKAAAIAVLAHEHQRCC